MSIQRLGFKNFRNLQNLDWSPSQGFVVLSGPNGAGKTNLLEGIYFTANLHHFPDSSVSQLVAVGEDFFSTQIQYHHQETETLSTLLRLSKDTGRWRGWLKTDNRDVKREQYLGHLTAISFLPQDLNLLTGSPSGRRRYLDETLRAVIPEYRRAHTQYTRVVRQRNQLWQTIASGGAGVGDMDVWDLKLAEHGSYLTERRREFLDTVNRGLADMLTPLSPELNSTRIVYNNSGPTDPQQFLVAIQSLRKRERQVASTLLGPHRDDFQAVIGERGATGFVSRGQLRSIVLALKLLEKQIVEKELTTPPILLLDDVFSELDTDHQKRLVVAIESMDQVFISTSQVDSVKRFFPKTSQIQNLRNGALVL